MGGLLSYNNYLDRIENSPLDRNDDNSRGYEGGEVGENTGGFAGKFGSAVKGIASLTGHSIPGPLGTGITAATDVMDGKSLKETAAKTTGKVAGATLGAAIAGPLGAILGGMLGSKAYESYEDGWVGDAMNARDDETARDNLEYGRYSYGESRDATSGEPDAPGTGGTPTERSSQEMSRASGLSAAAAAGYDDSGYGGSDSNGGRDNGNDTGHDGSGARGGGDEGNSSAGGIGGY